MSLFFSKGEAHFRLLTVDLVIKVAVPVCTEVDRRRLRAHHASVDGTAYAPVVRRPELKSPAVQVDVGGKAIRDLGIDVQSLAVIKEMRDGHIVFDHDTAAD